MSSFLTVIYALLLFSVIIFVHEFGHFIFAKIFGVYVHEFAIGMGPAIFKKKKGETLYSVRLVPMGGYCKMEGEDGQSDNSRAFSNKSKTKRLIILSAGAVMNLLLGFIVVLILNFGFSSNFYVSTSVANVLENTPAYTAGLRAGDKIERLNGKKVNIRSEFMVYNNKEDMEITVKRGRETLTFNVTPKSYLLDESGNIIKESSEEGSHKLIGIEFSKEEKTLLSVIKYSYFESLFIGKTIFISLGQLITGEVSPDNLSGPVGIVKEINTAANTGFDYLLYLMALITINLGIFNLLPLPALDGGRILFILIEAVIGKPVSLKYEGIIHAIGFMLLILLMLYATWNDILRIFTK
ncbi:MAG: RIP metalloprotease RseP [Clostridia bacterium]|nr:RIP metalloprotease RseP [Clostridia bacterium]